ncbi:MAG: hypothetical protein NC824_04760 [Candidatus Omnitrophica bacterium]|nr:hypothetical protein [Candidatus Omnitrophota bacterium]
MVKGIVVNVYMISVKSKELDLLHHTLINTTYNSENLIVSIDELKTALSKLNLERNDELRQFLKDIVKTMPNEVNYVWFYL